MARMKAIQATRPGSDWELVERDIPQPKADQVRVKVQACGVCHSTAVNPGEQRQRLGGARVTLATAPDSKAIASMVDGLGANGTLLIVAAPGEPVMVNAITLIGKRASVQGWPSGTSKDSEDTLRFSARTGVRPMIEQFPLARAEEAYQQMMNGRARFRAVLTMNP